ncbi:VWA domain-containing protein [Cronbergia sp. UHCC 0137]|uniref:VWA domain-containing protein n=1 Tax=Cronbergia sp. UHCC 0137 TaxID=3110239 RepID=UPI002B1F5D25|nr:VWA domain-containing protein [Cronbergia sp. UHCC 0137]MEA5621036.1 VWA domain-containing protein [Cronbergia sp. UHCC 0137]
MLIKFSQFTHLTAALSVVLLTACSTNTTPETNFTGLKVKSLVGSALGDFCNQAATNFNATQPKLENGTAFQVVCEAEGSGDVVSKVVSLATQLKNGTLQADAAEFPTIVSVDGEIYQNQLIYQVNQLFPGKNYIPEISDSPLVANSPMVFMAGADVAEGLKKTANPYKALVTAKTHRDIDPTSPPLTVNYVHTAPTRSNSGLQTLVAQFASVSGKRPEQLTVADVQQFQPQIQQIQSKITRYGISTNSLAQSMVKNGQFWASVGSVYESSVIAANTGLQPGQQRYQAVYPQVTFTSNMRAILPNAPWVSGDEKAGAEKFIEYVRSPEVQKIATDLGLRPGTPGVSLGAKFTPEFGVNPQPKYDSLRPPSPQVVEAMLKSWQQFAKKPSLVAVVVDSSGSMEGNKLPAVQSTLQNYINNLGTKEQIALIDFDSEIRPPVLADGTPQGRDRGLQFISGLDANGGTSLYDAALFARNWLQKNLRKDAINAVLILTDGEDSGSAINLEQLTQELQKSGFASDQRIAFFTVGYGKEGEFNPDVLKQIAELNGGYYAKGDPETISRLMADLQVEF